MDLIATQQAIRLLQNLAEDERRVLDRRVNQYALYLCDRAAWHLEQSVHVYLTGHAKEQAQP